jgi:hypothetical protein
MFLMREAIVIKYPCIYSNFSKLSNEPYRCLLAKLPIMSIFLKTHCTVCTRMFTYRRGDILCGMLTLLQSVNFSVKIFTLPEYESDAGFFRDTVNSILKMSYE